MAAPYTVALPDGRVLSDGDTITIAAVNATTGSAVSGVVVNNVVLEFEVVAGAASDLEVGAFSLISGPGA